MNKEKLLLEIDQLYEACITNTKAFHLKIDICIAPDYLVKKVFEMTDLDISNHWIQLIISELFIRFNNIPIH